MSLVSGGIAAAAMLGAAGIGAGATIHGANKAEKATSAGSRESIAYLKQKDAQERADKLAAERANYAQWAAREQRMKPYRAAGQGATNTIAAMLGLPSVNIPDPPPAPAYTQPVNSARTLTPYERAHGGTLADMM